MINKFIFSSFLFIWLVIDDSSYTEGELRTVVQKRMLTIEYYVP
jgi:hypothetical protein